jgi:hypothetical protein
MKAAGLFSSVCLCVISASAQISDTGSQSLFTPPHPEISELQISPNSISILHLRPNFATSILMPEPVVAVVLGDQSLFSAEHSEQDPELVVVKPATEHVASSNLTITTRSGQLVSLLLISDGAGRPNAPVDFVVTYKKPRDFLIPSDDPEDMTATAAPAAPSALDRAFLAQQQAARPAYAKGPQKITAAIGPVSNEGTSMIVSFSVLNRSDEWVEILPPQIELNNPDHSSRSSKKNVLADQVVIRDYRYTLRKLAPGARADGAVEFERPGYKQAGEQLSLELATADAVDRPLLLDLPFTAPTIVNNPPQEDQHDR